MGALYAISYQVNFDGSTPSVFAASFGSTSLESLTNMPATPGGNFVQHIFTATATGSSTTLQFTLYVVPANE